MQTQEHRKRRTRKKPKNCQLVNGEWTRHIVMEGVDEFGTTYRYEFGDPQEPSVMRMVKALDREIRSSNRAVQKGKCHA